MNRVLSAICTHVQCDETPVTTGFRELFGPHAPFSLACTSTGYRLTAEGLDGEPLAVDVHESERAGQELREHAAAWIRENRVARRMWRVALAPESELVERARHAAHDGGTWVTDLWVREVLRGTVTLADAPHRVRAVLVGSTAGGIELLTVALLMDGLAVVEP